MILYCGQFFLNPIFKIRGEANVQGARHVVKSGMGGLEKLLGKTDGATAG